MAEAIVRHFKTSEKVRQQNRKGVKRYRSTPKGRATINRVQMKRYYRLKAAGLCTICGQFPRGATTERCDKCATKVKAATTAWKARMIQAGICNRCGKAKCLPTMRGKCDSFCERCYFKKTSMSCLRTTKHADLIAAKLKKQGYRCAYTREKLILGFNDSLDHILPISRFSHLRTDPNNVEWVTRRVNCMKWDSTPEEFLETARLVLSHWRLF